jgi:hypothetical protein
LLNATKTSKLALRSNSRKMESIWLLKVQTRNHMKWHLWIKGTVVANYLAFPTNWERSYSTSPSKKS